MSMEPQFIRFDKDDTELVAGRPTYFVVNKKSGHFIGRVVWYAVWRCWVFNSAPNTVWSSGCLADVIDFIRALPVKGGGGEA